jgi:hypothetical protein
MVITHGTVSQWELSEMRIAHNTNAANSRENSIEFWKIAVVFIMSTAISTYGEMLLLKNDVIIAIGILAIVYFLGSLRLVPWKTPVKKAVSIGLFSGIVINIILWKYGIFI